MKTLPKSSFWIRFSPLGDDLDFESPGAGQDETPSKRRKSVGHGKGPRGAAAAVSTPLEECKNYFFDRVDLQFSATFRFWDVNCPNEAFGHCL